MTSTNPKRFFSHNATVFDVAVVASDDPHSHHATESVSTDVVFAAAYGHRDAFLAHVVAAHERIAVSKATAVLPHPDDEKLVKSLKINPCSDSAQLKAVLEHDFPAETNAFTWLKPWRNTGATAADSNALNAYARGSRFVIQTTNTFGKPGTIERHDGLLVCEATLLGSGIVQKDTGLFVRPPDGLRIDRFKIKRSATDLGTQTHSATLRLFANKDVLLDHTMAFAVPNDDRSRTLLLEYFAPDETTLEWVPVYSAALSVEYRFATGDLERQFYSKEYMADASSATQNARQTNAVELIKQGKTIAVIRNTPLREQRLFCAVDANAVSRELHAQRAQWLHGDSSLTPTTLLPGTAAKRGLDTAVSMYDLNAEALSLLNAAHVDDSEPVDVLAAAEVRSTSSTSSRSLKSASTKRALLMRMPRRIVH